MPVRIKQTIHAFRRGEDRTKCGLPLATGTQTKERVTCPACKESGSREFLAGWGRAIAEGKIDTEEPSGEGAVE